MEYHQTSMKCRCVKNIKIIEIAGNNGEGTVFQYILRDLFFTDWKHMADPVSSELGYFEQYLQ